MNVIQWLLDSDPSIRWQVMRDLTGEPAETVVVERSRVAIEGWGAKLLALQDSDGQWGRDVLPAGGEAARELPDVATRKLLRELHGVSLAELAEYIGVEVRPFLLGRRTGRPRKTVALRSIGPYWIG